MNHRYPPRFKNNDVISIFVLTNFWDSTTDNIQAAASKLPQKITNINIWDKIPGREEKQVL